MATFNVIRRWALREQMSIREIARRTGLARNTVKKYLRSEESEPRYARRASSSKLDPYAEKLAGWLVTEATKSRKQRRTLRQIHTDHDVWYALFAPAGTPPQVLRRLTEATVSVLNQPELIERLREAGYELKSSSSKAVSDRLKIDLAKWKQVVDRAKITLE